MDFKTADVAGLRLFYREAGNPSEPTIVLLHGFPSSSYQFHDLIPRLAGRFHVIAPDYPGMGYSDAPAPTVLRPTFDDVARVIDAFIAQRAPGPLILYLHDIGGPIGMRIATARSERIAGLIFQNFTISVEGWNPERLKVYERLGGPETPEKLAETEQFATVERDMFLHKTGARQPDALNPDHWAIDAYAFSIAANRVFMSRLFMNLTTNIQHCQEWTDYLKDRQPKTLIVWGRRRNGTSHSSPRIRARQTTSTPRSTVSATRSARASRNPNNFTVRIERDSVEGREMKHYGVQQRGPEAPDSKR